MKKLILVCLLFTFTSSLAFIHHNPPPSPNLPGLINCKNSIDEMMSRLETAKIQINRGIKFTSDLKDKDANTEFARAALAITVTQSILEKSCGKGKMFYK